LNAIAHQLASEYGTRHDGATIRLTRSGLVGEAVGAPARAFVWGLLVIAGLVLLTACAIWPVRSRRGRQTDSANSRSVFRLAPGPLPS